MFALFKLNYVVALYVSDNTHATKLV